MTLLIFPDPLDATCTLRLDDSGVIVTGTPAVHATGRKGQAFAIPDGTPDQHGSTLTLSASGKVTLVQRGILWLKPTGATFEADDFKLADGFVALPRLAVSGQFLGQV